MSMSAREKDMRVTRDLLLLAGIKVPLVDMREWSGWQFSQAEEWAAKVYSRASDNPVRVPAKPGFLKKYKEAENG